MEKYPNRERSTPVSLDIALREQYKSRINRVMDYIEENLDRQFTLDELAEQAYFSKYHFHRIFNAFIGDHYRNRLQLWLQ